MGLVLKKAYNGKDSAAAWRRCAGRCAGRCVGRCVGKVHTRQVVDEQGIEKGEWWTGRYDESYPGGSDQPVLEVVVIPR